MGWGVRLQVEGHRWAPASRFRRPVPVLGISLGVLRILNLTILREVDRPSSFGSLLVRGAEVAVGILQFTRGNLAVLEACKSERVTLPRLHR